VWQALQAAEGQGAGPAATEQGKSLDEQGQGSAGSGPSIPTNGGDAS
jgi:hypothetical protein